MIYPWNHYSTDPYNEPPDHTILDQPIHSNFACDLAPETATAIYQRDLQALLHARAQSVYSNQRATYPSLGLTLRQIIGTSWCNIHTGENMPVTHLGFDRFGTPQVNFNGITSQIVLTGPGLCVVEHWVQVTQPAIAAQWALHRLHFCTAQIQPNEKPHQWHQQHHRAALQAARHYLALGLLTPDQITQAQIVKDHAVQLAFF